MNDLQLFAFVILPILLVAGAGVLLLIERRNWRTASDEPDLFEEVPRPRSLANNEGLKSPARSRRVN